MHDEALTAAYEIGARVIETVVLASNEEGLRFAERHGYVEIDRYVLDGHTIPFIDLRLADIPQAPGERSPKGARTRAVVATTATITTAVTTAAG